MYNVRQAWEIFKWLHHWLHWQLHYQSCLHDTLRYDHANEILLIIDYGTACFLWRDCGKQFISMKMSMNIFNDKPKMKNLALYLLSLVTLIDFTAAGWAKHSKIQVVDSLFTIIWLRFCSWHCNTSGGRSQSHLWQTCAKHTSQALRDRVQDVAWLWGGYWQA